MKYRFLSSARHDLAETLDYYDNVASGLGLEFLDEVDRTIARILRHPEAWGSISIRHRRCLTRRFPYGVLYTMESGEIVITAVMNLRRHPDSWKARK